MSKIKTNIIYNITYQILVLIVPLITTPYISRILGAEGIGIFSYISSVVYYFYIFILLGLNNYGNRSIAKCRDNKEERTKAFWSIYCTQIILGIIIIFLYNIYIYYISDIKYKIFYEIYIFHVIGAILDINWFFFGIEEFKFTTIRNIAIKFITLVSIFYFVKGENALELYFFIVSISTLLSNLFLWTRIFKYVNFFKPTLKECLFHIKPNLILFLPIVALSIYRVMDKIMIKQLSSIFENGYYENADKIITISLTGFSAISTVMMPAISKLVANSDHLKVKQLLRDTMQVTNILSIAMVFGLISISYKFAPVFFGKEFTETGVLMMLLAPTIFLSGWKNILRSQYIIPYSKDLVYVYSLLIGAVCNIVVNMIFIPKYGARGAAIGTLTAEFIGFIIQNYIIAKEIKINILFKDFILFIPIGIIMGIVVYKIINLLPDNMLSIGIGIIIGCIIYILLVLTILFNIDKKRFFYLKKMYIKGEKNV